MINYQDNNHSRSSSTLQFGDWEDDFYAVEQDFSDRSFLLRNNSDNVLKNFLSNNQTSSFNDGKSRVSTILPVKNDHRSNIFDETNIRSNLFDKTIELRRKRTFIVPETPEIDHPMTKSHSKNSSSQKQFYRGEKNYKTEDELDRVLPKLDKNYPVNPFYP